MYIIGIAGGTGSGKTTVVKKIVKVLPTRCAAVIPLDSYYNDTTGLTDEERNAINFDHPDAFDWKLLTEHIKMLKNGEAIEHPPIRISCLTAWRRRYTLSRSLSLSWKVS